MVQTPTKANMSSSSAGISDSHMVLTKTDDGGTHTTADLTGFERQDSFLHYSDDIVRMRHLLGFENSEPRTENTIRDLGRVDQGENQADGDINDNHEHARKTCLSFELHVSKFAGRRSIP